MQSDCRKASPPRKRGDCGQQRVGKRRHWPSGSFPTTISKTIPAALSESCGQTSLSARLQPVGLAAAEPSDCPREVPLGEGSSTYGLGEYALRQRRSEPKLTAAGRAEDSVREQCQRRKKLRETYAHCSNSQTHGSIQSQPRHCRCNRIVGPFGDLGGRSAVVDHASQAEGHRARSHPFRAPARRTALLRPRQAEPAVAREAHRGPAGAAWGKRCERPISAPAESSFSAPSGLSRGRRSRSKSASWTGHLAGAP